MNCKKLVGTIIFLLCGLIGFSQTISVIGMDLEVALERITKNSSNQDKIRSYLGLLIGGSFTGIEHIYETFYAKGRFLFAYQEQDGMTVSLVIDSELVRKSEDIYSGDDCYYKSGELFTNLASSSFDQLVIEYLSTHYNIDRINRSKLRKTFIKNYGDYGFDFFYANNGINLIWRENIGSGSYIINLPYSVIQNYLTPIGKEIFR